MTIPSAAAGKAGARERILSAAYPLFCRRGIRAVGVDEVITRSAVAKATFYKYFPSKDDLVLAFLARREQVWTRDRVEAGSQRLGATPQEQLLAVFDVFDDWIREEPEFEGCSFINVLLELGPAHPAARASVHHLAAIRAIMAGRAARAGLRDPEDFAHSFHILMKGALIAASEGDARAARRAKDMARRLIADHQDADSPTSVDTG